MRIQQISNLFREKISGNKNSKAQDLTSFGQKNADEPKDNQLISHDAAESLKNKYMANISFSGHTEYLQVNTDMGPYKIRYVSTYGSISDYESYDCKKVKEYERNPVTYAQVDNGPTIEIGGAYARTAALDAIRSSSSCGPHDRIEEINPVRNDLKGVTTRSVYFTDPYEVVYSSDKAGKDYVVYANGAHDAHDTHNTHEKQKKSFWDKLFG